ncbi:uncharacterized protein [Primulina huaijiensis]|uniref:uncharacterized protein isoform X2 n=1 Tax=Primulina huaijiensis TaxID=1492673 RepID=UPI003CC78D02
MVCDFRYLTCALGRNACGAAEDFKRTMSMCYGFQDEQNDFRKQLEAESVDPGYRQFLLFNLRGLKRYKPHKKEVDGEHICGGSDDSDEVSDPQYELFFESLKKYEKSYVLEGRINDVSVCVKYEGESKFGGKRVPECARKMRKDIGRVGGASDLPNVRNEQAPVNQHASDNRRNEILKEKPDLRNKGIIEESEIGFSKSLSKRMNNLGNCKVSKNMTFVQEDNLVTDNQSEPHGQARLRKADEGEDVAKAYYVPDSESVIRISCDGNQYQSPNPRNNTELKNQSELVGPDQPIKREKVLKGKIVVLSKHNLDTEKHLYIKPDPKHNSATKYKVDRANQVVPSEEDKEVQSKTNLPKVMQEKNVLTTNDRVANRRKAENYRDNEPLYSKPSPEKNLEEHQHDDVDQTQPGMKYKVQNQRKLRKQVHGSYEIKVDDAVSTGAADQSPRLPNEQAPVNQHASDNRRNEILKKPDLRNKGIIKESEVGFSKPLSKRMNNLRSCKVSKSMTFVQEDNILTDNKSPNPINNSESKNHSEPVSQAQSIKKKKVLKGKNVVLSDHNLDTQKHLYIKPDPKHNSATKYQANLANQVVPGEEDKEVQSKRNLPKVMGEKNVATNDCVANIKAVNYKDNENLYPKPSPEKNLEEHQHEDVDQTQPGKKCKVRRKLRKVVHGSYEIKVDDADSRNNVAQIEDKPLFHKPCQRKNQVTKNCADQAHPKQRHSMFMKEIVITDDSDSEVEILDSALFYRAGNRGSIVTSKKFHKSVLEDDDVKLPGRTSPRFDFRRQVMNVLQEPYDKQESKSLLEAFKAGSYVKFHSELVKILAARRQRKGKCLAILRGFFFWLEFPIFLSVNSRTSYLLIRI